MQTDTYKLTQRLIIRNGNSFDMYFPIEKSERTFLVLVPFIREAQRLKVERAYGDGWDELLAEKAVPESDVHYAACMAVALFAMAAALRRLPLRIFPSGVIRGYMAKNGMADSRIADTDDIVRVAEWMEDDAAVWLDEMKRVRDGIIPVYDLLPKNDERNKYCRL